MNKAPLLTEDDIARTFSLENIRRTEIYSIIRELSKFQKINQSKVSREYRISRRALYDWLHGNRAPYPLISIEWLKTQGVVPFHGFNLRNEMHQLLFDIYAFMFGDGSLDTTYIELSGFIDDLQQVNNSLRRFFPSINMNLFKSSQNSYSLFIYSSQLARFFIALGCPLGSKQTQEYLLPSWITEDRELSKRWLEIFLSNECNYINERRKVARIEQYKALVLEDNLIAFLNQVRRLLERFKVKVSHVKEGPTYRRKDGIWVKGYYINIYRDKLNILKFLTAFTFRAASLKEKINRCTQIKLRKDLELQTNRINSYLYAKKARELEYKRRQLKTLFNDLRNGIQSSVTWNTFYNSYSFNTRKPKYLEKIAELKELGFAVLDEQTITKTLRRVV